MVGKRLQVQHLRSLGLQSLQQPGFTRACGAANHPVIVACSQLRQISHQRRPEGLVATIDQRHPETDLVQDQRQRTAAFAAAPAIHQRLPVARLVQHLALNVGRNVLGDQRGADFFGLELADLLVTRADDFSLLVVQAGPVDGARQMVLRVFVLAAGVNHVAVIPQSGQCRFGRYANQAHGMIFFNSGQTLASMRAWDCSLG